MATVIEHIAVTAVTDAGGQSAPRRASAVITDGVLIGSAPNAVRARATAAPAGAIDVTIFYNPRGQSAVATDIEIVAYTPGSQPDFTTPLATIGVGRVITGRTARIAGPYADGETVHLAARAVTAATAGPVTLLLPVVARSVGPPAAAYLEGSQV